MSRYGRPEAARVTSSGTITWTGTAAGGWRCDHHVRSKRSTSTLGAIAVNPAVISGGGDTFTRTATVTVDGPICNLTKQAGNPVLPLGFACSWDDAAGAGCPQRGQQLQAVVHLGEDGATPSRIGLATSTDGVHLDEGVRQPGSIVRWGYMGRPKGVSVGSVIFDGGLYKMWYTGLLRHRGWLSHRLRDIAGWSHLDDNLNPVFKPRGGS